MFAGPIFSREALIAPRQLRHFVLRSGYVAALFVLMYTTMQATFGWQQIRNVGDIARFGSLVFQILSIVQLALVLFFALLFAAGNVAMEKDRKTLILLLMTDLRSSELVLGKLCASLLIVAVLLAASVPVFAFLYLLGGVTLEQIGWALALCGTTALAAGSWGTLVAYWREKTFQTLAVSVLGLMLFLGLIEGIIAVAGANSVIGLSLGMLNPFRALAGLLSPFQAAADAAVPHVSALGPVLAQAGLAAAMILGTIARLRVWNPPRAIFEQTKTEEDAETGDVRAVTRTVWRNPVIWREICTLAYGRKVILIKLAYVALASFVAYSLYTNAASDVLILGMFSPIGAAFIGLGLLSLILINAQAVTALTSERDLKSIELLLMTDVTAKEFIFGKLGGVLYNTKELVLIPILLVGYYTVWGFVSWENFAYLLIGYLVLVAFAAMLGLHFGLSFDNSRTAILTSLGTMFFLFIGIFIFIMLLVEARSSFSQQLISFLVFIVAGSIGLWWILTQRNPSNALMLAAGGLPFLTFYSLTEFLLGGSQGVCLAMSVAYGFTTLAMLIPAISEFDVALGRTTMDKG